MSSVANADPSRPKLVVGIVVDQLRTDYIEYLQTYFSERGFRRLMKDGVYMQDVDFKVSSLDAPSATAMIYTGSYPSQTGVPSAMVYDHSSRKRQPALADSKTLGNFTNDAFSAESLRLSTLSDEIAVDGAGFAAIYAFSPDPQQSIIMAGHAGTSACWINNTSGNWATTTYYKSLPQPVSSRNYSYSVGSRIDTMQWKPSINIKEFPRLPNQKKMYPFRHTFSRSDKDVYNKFTTSPMVNAEITDVAIECLKTLKPGASGNTIDMLNIGYTVAPFKFVNDGDFRAELTDSYLRLDKQLQRLFDAIDKYVGAGNALIWVCSTGYYNDAVVDDKKYRIPTGEFSIKRAESLLNAYLSALHGNADYIDAIKDNQIYFNHKLLEEKGLKISDVVADARSFIAKMSGISDAYTLNDILSPSTPELERLRLSIDPKLGGDIYVLFHPGWTVIDDVEYPSVSHPVRETPILSPAFIMGPGVTPKKIERPVDATALAPTLAGVLRIRSPNGAVSKPLLVK